MKLLPAKLISTLLLAGVASASLAGTAAARTLTLQLPDGTVETIDYAGNVAPRISLVPAQPAAAATAPSLSPFALMQQISAQMDREADAMMRQMQQIAAQPLAGPGQPVQADMTTLPPGTQSYRFVSTFSPNGVCSQSTEIVARGPGQKPQVITHSAGKCGAPSPAGASTTIAAPDRAPAMPSSQPPAQTYQAQAIDHPDYRSMFKEARW